MVARYRVVPDASPGELAHQQNKSSNKSDCGRNPPKHYAKRANDNAAMLALANGLEYRVRKYNFSEQKHEIVSVSPGAGGVRLMSMHARTLGHDRVPTDVHATETQTTAQLKGQFPGSAIWSAHLYKDNDVQVDDGSWGARVSGGNFRPDEAALIAQYKVYYGCGGDEQCSDIRCPFCWDEEDTLDSSLLECSRHMRVAQVVSCGQGRLKGGDVKAAARPGPPDDWALGQGQADDVEIFNKPPPTGDHGPPPADQLTLSKIIYFFRQRGNKNSLSGEPPPFTWWVLAYEYVGVGHGNERVPDSITRHPTLSLRGRGRPKVYLVHAIRRQGAGSDRVSRRKFRLALPGSSNGYDKYLLNEDTFV
ncbi:unnamed protein product [Ectocarpus sp. CCAP 1310/34]|nr:unnamed protein product [Ectocarpus sp. CCAP 1310/34]